MGCDHTSPGPCCGATAPAPARHGHIGHALHRPATLATAPAYLLLELSARRPARSRTAPLSPATAAPAHRRVPAAALHRPVTVCWPPPLPPARLDASSPGPSPVRRADRARSAPALARYRPRPPPWPLDAAVRAHERARPRLRHGLPARAHASPLCCRCCGAVPLLLVHRRALAPLRLLLCRPRARSSSAPHSASPSPATSPLHRAGCAPAPTHPLAPETR
nr:translation initiation factor IF-2-like [Aegilops tauschii subsp. strangulata]